MAAGDGQPEIPIGQVLFENLTKALLQNTNAQIAAAAIYRELLQEVKTLREDLEGMGGLTDNVLGHMTTALRLLDHIAIVGADRAPTWKDVREVLQQIKDEIQQEEEQEEEEEEGEQDQQGQPGAAPIFPRKKSS
jgi:molybdopterin synthase catalytic subunit